LGVVSARRTARTVAGGGGGTPSGAGDGGRRFAGRAPRAHPLLGHFPDFRRDPLAFLTRCAREGGDFVPLRFLGQRLALLSDPAGIEQVLVTRQQLFTKSPGLRRNPRLLGNGLVASTGDLWRRQRRLMQPAFHRQHLAAYGEVMVARAQRLLARWRDGEVRDVHAEMMRVTLEIVGDALFGADLADDAATVGAAFAAVLERFRERTSGLLFLLPERVPTPGNLRYERTVRRLDEVVYRLIARRRAAGGAGDDLLALLLRAQDEAGVGMSDAQLRDEVMTLVLAGHETTAIALSWTWYLLAQHPEAERRLHDELRDLLGGRSPAAADLPRLRYAEAVVTEAMRLYPPAWLISRQAVEACEVAGYRVPAGTVVLMSQWVLHRDPRFFTAADAFSPERWLDGPIPGAAGAGAAGALAERLPRFAYFPFGGGPRLCIGRGFAMAEAVLLLASVAQRYVLGLAPGQSVVPAPVVTLRPRHGIKMVLRARRA
jgi:cytochrome P450